MRLRRISSLALTLWAVSILALAIACDGGEEAPQARTTVATVSPALATVLAMPTIDTSGFERPTPFVPPTVAARTTPPDGYREVLYIVNADGSEPREAWEGRALGVTWSPDGRTIAFLDGHTRVLYVLEVASGDLRSLASNASLPLSWSPDGLQLLIGSYEKRTPAPEGPYVAMVDAQTGAVRQLVEGIYGMWSPDGARVAFSGPTCERRHDWRVYDLASGAVTDILPAYPDAWVFMSPDWSRVAFFKDPVPPEGRFGTRLLYVANLDGSDEHALPATDRGWGWPSWSPDGEWLTYSLPSTGEDWPPTETTYLVPADGSTGPIALTRGGYVYAWARDSSAVLIGGKEELVSYEAGTGVSTTIWDGPVGAQAYSPDGSMVAFVLSDVSGETLESDLYVYDTASGEARQVTWPPVRASIPIWSPDSQRLAIARFDLGFDHGPCL